MHISVSCDSLKEAIKDALQVVQAKWKKMENPKVFLFCEEDFLWVGSYGEYNEVSYWSKIPAKVISPGGISILPNPFIKELNTIKKGVVEVQFSNNSLYITSSLGKKVVLSGGAEIPEDILVPTETAQGKIVLSVAKFQQIVASVAIASAEETFQTYPLESVLIRVKGEKIRMIAADGYRMAMQTITAISSDIPEGVFAVSAVALRKVASLLKKEKKGEIVIAISPEFTYFQNNQTLVAYRSTLNKEFPDYGRLEYTTVATEVTIAPALLKEAVAKIIPLLREKNSSKYLEAKVSQRGITLLNGEEEIFIECSSVEGEEVRIGVNYSFLMDAIQAISGKDMIIKLNGSSYPLILICPESEEKKYIIMPMTLKTR